MFRFIYRDRSRQAEKVEPAFSRELPQIFINIFRIESFRKAIVFTHQSVDPGPPCKTISWS